METPHYIPADPRAGSGARLSADIGGTFTDVVLQTQEGARSCKVLTTPLEPEAAVLAGVGRLLQDAMVNPKSVTAFVHGTTLATNAILERRGARTALLTTAGFRDVLELGYEGRYDPADLMIRKPEPIVPRTLRFGVAERIGADGEVLVRLDEGALRAMLQKIRRTGIESIAIGFLHSYVNPTHELRARTIISQLLPEVSVSLSSEVCAEIREYERISTVVANAYVQPLVSAYLTRLLQQLHSMGLACPAFLMTSGGGLVPFESIQTAPIRLVESGPAGGAILAASIGQEMMERRILSFDMGGTTAKICFVSDGNPQVTSVFEVDRAARFKKGSGLPLRIPVVELVEIGAGGGSIIGLDGMKRISVGPQSAGSEPGPASYGRGGARPTVSDADLVLGRLDAERFAGGKIRLDPARAANALLTHVADPLNLHVTEAAFGAVEIVDEMMANAARVHAAELGRELIEHTMVAFGGAAPLHACRVAEKLGIRRVIIPSGAGVGSALGFLRAPISYDVVVSRPVRLSHVQSTEIAEFLERMQRNARDLIGSDTWGTAGHVTCKAEMRYAGQGHEITVPVRVEAGQLSADRLLHAFEQRYAELFGRTIPGAPVEVLSWKVGVSRETWRPQSYPDRQQKPTRVAMSVSSRSVFDAEHATFIDYEAFERGRLSPGDKIAGPALIVEDETTTVVSGRFTAFVHPFAHLVLERRVKA